MHTYSYLKYYIAKCFIACDRDHPLSIKIIANHLVSSSCRWFPTTRLGQTRCADLICKAAHPHAVELLRLLEQHLQQQTLGRTPASSRFQAVQVYMILFQKLIKINALIYIVMTFTDVKARIVG